MVQHLASTVTQAPSASHPGTVWLYAGFLLLVAAIMVFDLGIGGRTHQLSTRVALRRTAFMVSMALGFTVAIYFMYERHWLGVGLDVPQLEFEAGERMRREVGGREAAVLYFTGWLVEYSLSLDNLFVFLMIFRFFAVPPPSQHRALVWGIVCAIVLRGAIIFPGAWLAEKFAWVTYAFGAFLVFSAFKMYFLGDDDEVDLDRNIIVRCVRALFRVSATYDRDRFTTRVDDSGAIIAPERRVARTGRFAVTPLFVVLAVVEFSDVVFAVDSIPAIFGITLDRFIVFTSNIFAILGLRALYFALAALLDQFRYLKMSMVVILLFVGTKMLLHKWLHEFITPPVSLGIIASLLAAGIVPSLIYNRRVKREFVRPIERDVAVLADAAYRNAKKLVILVIGSTVVLIGVAGFVLPVLPGWILVFVGLAILATEFIWARRLLKRLKSEAESLVKAGRGLVGLDSGPAKLATPDTDPTPGKPDGSPSKAGDKTPV